MNALEYRSKKEDSRSLLKWKPIKKMEV